MMNNYRETDPEFAERFEHFAFDEVVNEPGPVSYTHLLEMPEMVSASSTLASTDWCGIRL